jgi:hypothetical protein
MPVVYHLTEFTFMETQENILDTFENTSKRKRLLSNSTVLVLLVLSIVTVVIDIVLVMDRSEDVINSGNNLFNSKEKIFGLILVYHLIVVPAASLLLSLIVSLIPLKGKKYSEKYLSVAVIIMTLLQFLFLTFTILGV